MKGLKLFLPLLIAVMAFSEFGRRVKENGSLGTDHGTAGPVFLLGSQVEAGVHGKTPSLTDIEAGDLRASSDFRELYASLLDQWLELPRPTNIEPFQGPPLFKTA